MTPEQLVSKCIVRDKTAWNEFVRQYEGTVKKAVYYKIRRMNAKSLMSEVDDISQEVFLTLWEGNRLNTLKDTRSIKGWLSIVAINRTITYLRKRIDEAHKTSSLDESIPGSDVKYEDVIASEDKTDFSSLAAKDIEENMFGRKSNLTERERMFLKLSIFGGLKQREIAGEKGISENTVATIIRRGKKKLRRKVQAYVTV